MEVSFVVFKGINLTFILMGKLNPKYEGKSVNRP
jgi:hypothetical protein